jgi:hypothetical protein
MDRRKFLETTASGALAAGVVHQFGWATGGGTLTDAERAQRLGVCSWSLHN